MENCDRNLTVNYTDSDWKPPGAPWSSWIIVLIIIPFVMAFGVVCNSAFIFVVYHVKRMRTITNFFLVNLAITDSALLVVAFAQYIGSYINFNQLTFFSFYSVAGCVLPNFLVYLCYYTSLWTISLVSIERYLAVCHPLLYRHMNNTGRAIGMICFAWAISLGFASLTIPHRVLFTYCTVSEKQNVILQKISQCGVNRLWIIAAIFSTDLLQFLISHLLNLILFSLIVKSLNSKMMRTDKEQDRVRINVVKMLIINNVVFFICLVPFSILNFFYICRYFGLFHQVEMPGYVEWLGRVLFLVNSALNPVVYNIANSRYRDAFKQAFYIPCLERKEQPSDKNVHVCEGQIQNTTL